MKFAPGAGRKRGKVGEKGQEKGGKRKRKGEIEGECRYARHIFPT